MIKKSIAVLAIILVAFVGIYYVDMANFIKQDSCLDGGGVWRQQQQKCLIPQDRLRDLPEWMAKYAVVEPEADLSGEADGNSVGGHRQTLSVPAVVQ